MTISTEYNVGIVQVQYLRKIITPVRFNLICGYSTDNIKFYINCGYNHGLRYTLNILNRGYNID